MVRVPLNYLIINIAEIFSHMARHPLMHSFNMPGNEPPLQRQILIIDDDLSIRYMLGRILVGEGYAVSAAANGEAGLKIAGKGDIDLVLLDLKMPGMSGQETFNVLRAERPEVPVIIISAFSRQQLAGMDGVSALLQKPLDFPTLLDTIKRILALPVAPG
ncbi:MAG TPA: response regulator [Candidatus Baltobacteraceae bacterium]|nr:response regulator [Candidatus Baltobacteraceae bacterium]